MMLNNILCFFFAIPMPVVASAPVCCKAEFSGTKDHQQILESYLSVWSVNLAEKVFHPDVVDHSDRFPFSDGKDSDLVIGIDNRNTFITFIQKSRKDWMTYTFNPIESTVD